MQRNDFDDATLYNDVCSATTGPGSNLGNYYSNGGIVYKMKTFFINFTKYSSTAMDIRPIEA